MDRQLYNIAGLGLGVAFYYGYTKQPVLRGQANAIASLDSAGASALPRDTTLLFLGKLLFAFGMLALLAEAGLLLLFTWKNYTHQSRSLRRPQEASAGGAPLKSAAAAAASGAPGVSLPSDLQQQSASKDLSSSSTNQGTAAAAAPAPREAPRSAAARTALNRNPSQPGAAVAAAAAAIGRPASVRSSQAGSTASRVLPEQDREAQYEERRRSAVALYQQRLDEDAERAQRAEQERAEQQRAEQIREIDARLQHMQETRSEQQAAMLGLQAALDSLAAARAAAGAQSSAAGSAAAAGTTSAASANTDRQLREEQDREFEDSLRADQDKAAAAAAAAAAGGEAVDQGQVGSSSSSLVTGGRSAEGQQQLVEDGPSHSSSPAAGHPSEPTEEQLKQLQELKETLQGLMGQEPEVSEPGVVTLRVRLPGGAAVTRRFRGTEQYSGVEAWVQGLEQMPLWAPGSWRLASSFPRMVLVGQGDVEVVAKWKEEHGVGGEGSGKGGPVGLTASGGQMVRVGSLQEVQHVVADGGSQLALFVLQL